MITFSHAGKMGDVLSSLYFCIETAAHYVEPKNNLPLGGWANSVSFTPKMVDAVKELIRM